jgi:hypothetical protein
MCEPELPPPPPFRLFCFLFLLLPRHLTGFILLRSMHKRFHIMLIVPFVVVYSKSCPGHCGSQGREKEKTRTGKLWLSFSLHLSLCTVYHCVSIVIPREIETKNNWENTKKPKILEAEGMYIRIFQWNPLSRSVHIIIMQRGTATTTTTTIGKSLKIDRNWNRVECFSRSIAHSGKQKEKTSF